MGVVRLGYIVRIMVLTLCCTLYNSSIVYLFRLKFPSRLKLIVKCHCDEISGPRRAGEWNLDDYGINRLCRRIHPDSNKLMQFSLPTTIILS